MSRFDSSKSLSFLSHLQLRKQVHSPLIVIYSDSDNWLPTTYTALGSEKTSAWMCIIRSPPAAYSMTKQTCSAVWKQANRLTRKGCRTLLTVSKILFSHIKLPKRGRQSVSHSRSS